jgi:phage tail sheath protein FI
VKNMSAAYTYPGVYVEELPSSVRTIIGVGTSITAFVGRALKGPTDKATTIYSYADYVRIFGGLWKKSTMSYAVYHYFQNGGVVAIIVRATKNASPAKFTFNIKNTPNKTDNTTKNDPTNKPDTPKPDTPNKADKTDKITELIKLRAADPGLWGTKLEIVLTDADEEKKNQDADPTYINLAVYQKTDSGERGALLELFHNVSLNPEKPRYISKLLVNGVSTYLRVDGTIPESIKFQPQNTEYISDLKINDSDNLDGDALDGETIKNGMYALEDVDLFNLLCIPAYSEDDSRDNQIYSDALTFCNAKRAILLVDPPAGNKSWKSSKEAREKFSEYITLDKNGAIFFPRIIAPDPLEEYRLKEFDPCGAVAGVIARTDAQRGVWKAPAGIEAALSGVPDLAVRLTNQENGELNPKGINCLRILPDAGRVIWGSRTLRGADTLADQWKYLPVRRMALYIEESLYRGTQWVVFEPNDEKLWSQIRLNVGAFMHSLFTKGAFQGTDPKKAYLVKCDSETTTQNDIDKGIVNILVGFAPLKPAEFVILKIQQLAGQDSA